jgi:hypothetical protein
MLFGVCPRRAAGARTQRENEERNEMDLKMYYHKIREQEAGIGEEYPVIVSHETADGGKAGSPTEVPRRLAAKMVVEGLARLASAGETQKFRELQAAAKRTAEQLAAAATVQVTVLASAELEKLRNAANSKE